MKGTDGKGQGRWGQRGREKGRKRKLREGKRWKGHEGGIAGEVKTVKGRGEGKGRYCVGWNPWIWFAIPDLTV
jgi:hypothetical protein